MSDEDSGSSRSPSPDRAAKRPSRKANSIPYEEYEAQKRGSNGSVGAGREEYDTTLAKELRQFRKFLESDQGLSKEESKMASAEMRKQMMELYNGGKVKAGGKKRGGGKKAAANGDKAEPKKRKTAATKKKEESSDDGDKKKSTKKKEAVEPGQTLSQGKGGDGLVPKATFTGVRF